MVRIGTCPENRSHLSTDLTRMKNLSLGFVLLPSLLSMSTQTPIPQGTQATPEQVPSETTTDWDWRAVLRHVLPQAEELVWQDLPWEPSLHAGLAAGRAQDKPVLLWAMNGHPLAST